MTGATDAILDVRLLEALKDSAAESHLVIGNRARVLDQFDIDALFAKRWDGK
jgi:3-polyprenyl-4-hydroxybenzoate decarboxylase